MSLCEISIRDNHSALAPSPSEKHAGLARRVLLCDLGERLVERSSSLVGERVQRAVRFSDDVVLGVVGKKSGGRGVDVRVEEDLQGRRGQYSVRFKLKHA